MTPALRRRLRLALGSSAGRCTPDFESDVDRALEDFRQDVPWRAWRQRRAAIMGAAAAAESLVAAFAVIDQAFAGGPPPAPDARQFLINTCHEGLRGDAATAAATWRKWLGSPHVPRASGSGRQRDHRREDLGLAVLRACGYAGIPMSTTRGAPIEQVLQVVLKEAIPHAKHLDLHADLRRWIAWIRFVYDLKPLKAHRSRTRSRGPTQPLA